jgi:hypothetical protein
MESKIIGFHQDESGDWVADLSTGTYVKNQ